MGEVREKIKLTNLKDKFLFEENLITEDKIRSIEIDALVDTGAVMTVIPEYFFKKLGLVKKGKELVEYANGEREEVPVGGTVEVMSLSSDRSADMRCVVLGNEVILGQLFLEETDLVVDCRSKKIIPNPDHKGQLVINIKQTK
ncbi:MAG: retroviral-like aspartic protease family protein [Desulfobacterales bacterium]|nr:retroviral-like aspartic protease family protein [Desulfobacterales bacterium]